MKKNIYIGSLYPDSVINSMMRYKTSVDFASNTFENSLLHGLLNYIDFDEIIVSPLIRLGFREKKGYKPFEYTYEKTKAYFIGSVNIPIIRIIFEFIRIYQRLRCDLIEEKKNVVVYSLHSPFLLAVLLNRKRIRHSTIIVPDLPQYMSNDSNIIKKFGKFIDRKIINYALKVFNSFVVLSDFMREELPIYGKPCVRIEGIYMHDESVEEVKKEKNKTILYTGVISSRYGVFDLLEAFHSISADDYRLWLCGSTNEKGLLKEYLEKDIRIKYFGLLPKSDIRKMQRKATLLVNPRHSNEKFTKYSFPSKTMEYLASGTATVMCKLPAIPEEYMKYLFFFEDESIEGMKNTIISICSDDAEMLEKKGREASYFIINNKNEKIQARKIVELLK